LAIVIYLPHTAEPLAGVLGALGFCKTVVDKRRSCVFVGRQNCHRADLIARFETIGEIRGVAYLDDAVGKIYAVCENWSTICVFHAVPPFEQLRGIHVGGLRDPSDIAACGTNQLLYVSDCAEGCVWQVTTGGKVDWRLPERRASSVCPAFLSVGFGRLVVGEAHSISIYDPHDDKVDGMAFPESVTLHHAVESDRKTFLVALSDAGQSAVREFKPDGGGEWTRLREWSSGPSRASVGRPLYMACDAAGSLYVAVFGSHRVLVLDQSLNVLQSVRLYKRSAPKRMCFLARRQKSLLIVGASSSVDMYDGVCGSFPPKQRRYVWS